MRSRAEATCKDGVTAPYEKKFSQDITEISKK